ncbi:DNA polymerase beta-like [Opisthocomus hoazin]|uniref:DNA polymerase beta-like n=1 Tax=Opisthocomus hoazin TaxID=30419 RepID=UPI003F5373AD
MQKLEQPIHSRPDKYPGSPVHQERLVKMRLQVSLPTHKTRCFIGTQLLCVAGKPPYSCPSLRRVVGSRPGEKHCCSILRFTRGDRRNTNTRVHAVERGFTVSVSVSHPLHVLRLVPNFCLLNLSCDVLAGGAGRALPEEREDTICDYVHGRTRSQRTRVNPCLPCISPRDTRIAFYGRPGLSDVKPLSKSFS